MAFLPPNLNITLGFRCMASRNAPGETVAEAPQEVQAYLLHMVKHEQLSYSTAENDDSALGR